MRVKVARRYQITIPEEVREDAGINIGDTLDVRSQDGKVIIKKVAKDWEKVMDKTGGSWRDHPTFRGMKDSVEIVNWLRQKSRNKSQNAH
jgi:AbrB family looped-hinge helix DNA binding protein